MHVYFRQSIGKGIRDGEFRLKAAIRRYRCLCVHIGGFNDVFGPLNVMMHRAAIAFAIFSVYGALRTEGALSVATAYWGTFTLVVYQMVVICKEQPSVRGIPRESTNGLGLLLR